MHVYEGPLGDEESEFVAALSNGNVELWDTSDVEAKEPISVFKSNETEGKVTFVGIGVVRSKDG